MIVEGRAYGGNHPRSGLVRVASGRLPPAQRRAKSLPLEFRVLGLGFRVSGFGFRVLGFGV